MTPTYLASAWRARAEDLHRYGAEQVAATLEACAHDLEEAWRVWQTEPLSTAEAAAESGYTEDHLRQLVREGKLPDDRKAGSQGPLVFRRCDLPRKAQRDRVSTPTDDLAEILRTARR